MGDRPAKVDEKKSDRKLEREKKKGEFFCWKKSMKILQRWRENEKCQRPPRGKLGAGGKKVNKNTYDIFLHKTCNQEVSGSFTSQTCKTTTKKCTKKVCIKCKVAILLISRTVVFHRSRCLRRSALHDFIFCLSKL